MKKLIIAVVATAMCAPLCAQKKIDRVRFMPDMPSPYVLRDWRQVARDYDDFVFSFQTEGEHFPINRWDDSRQNFKGRSFSMVSYIGAPGGDEGINNMAAVVSASLVGIDKSRQNGHNFVEMCQKWFSSDNGTNLYCNNPSSDRSWERIMDWYASLPNMLAFQLNDLYPGVGELSSQVIEIADFYVGIADKLERDDRSGAKNPNMQRDLGAAVAWIEYMAWTITGERKYLQAADKGIEYLLRSEVSPLYEMLLPYGAYVAARMNAELGRTYDVTRLLNWCFDGSPLPRHGWGVIADRWNGYDMHGLQGSITDGDGYAFAMNTFQMAGALTPLVRYDKGFAHDIGKWMLNVANNSRMFYANAYGPDNQSNPKWTATYDPRSVIAYEGVRKFKRGWDTALADVRTPRGKRLAGDWRDTRYKAESPVRTETFVETRHRGQNALEHVWELNLPEQVPDRWLVVAAEALGGNNGNDFCFSIAEKPDGPFKPLLTVKKVPETDRPIYAPVPRGWKHLFVKAESTDPGSTRQADTLRVDALGVTYKSDISPYATGDFVVSFVALIDNYTVPIVCYRPEEAATDLGLYGSSHVGILGGLIEPTDVEGILRLDLLRTDYYHAEAFPSYLYYNPCDRDCAVSVEVGDRRTDIYDTVSSRFVAEGVSGTAKVTIPAKGAAVLVLTPSGGVRQREGGRLLVDGKIVDFGSI